MTKQKKGSREKAKVLVSFILDETGSMQVVKGPTISGFNEYVQSLRQEDNADDVRFMLTKFNSEKIELVHDSVKLSDVALLDDASYSPNYLTPLYDVIGKTIKAISDDGCNVLFVIQTDGQENYSKEFTREAIFTVIAEKKKAGWTFVFLGADQDAWDVGMQLGLDKGNVMSYNSAETKAMFRTLSTATGCYTRSGGTLTADFFQDPQDTIS
ncbi:MAG: VWA domain-containing protein [Chloroflexi bacterium]|nr:VWA domain-containing protein [Chloroflexota bacterium]